MTRSVSRTRTDRGWSLAYALAWPCALASGCASLSSLTGGEERDGGADARAAHDAALDRRSASSEAGSSEAGDDGGERDATIDSGAPDAADARVAVDATVPDGRAVDAARDVLCVPTVVDAGPNVACPVAEAGACAPTSPPDGAVVFHPPHTILGACTLPLVEDFLGACISSYSTQASCDAYVAMAPALACAKCLYGSSTASTYGPIVDTGEFAFLNVGGCLALADPCNVGCAVAEETNILCTVAACDDRCFPDGGAADADYAAYSACTTASETCACASQNGVASACYYALNDQPSTAPCFGVGTFNESVEAIASLFCINGTWDGGTSD